MPGIVGSLRLTAAADSDRLRECFGRVTEMRADNADGDDHMIAINETLGYTTVDATGGYQRSLESRWRRRTARLRTGQGPLPVRERSGRGSAGAARTIRLPPGSPTEHTGAMRIIELDPADEELVSGAFDVMRAAHAVDTPEHPPPHRGMFAKTLRHPVPEADTVDFVAVVDGTVRGRLHICLFNRSNRHVAVAELTVHPEHRRRGVGAALLDRFIEHARAHDRTELLIETPMTWEGGPERDEAGRRFLERRGFKRALTSVNRRCATDALDAVEEQELLDRAAAAAAEDYEIVSWVGRTPGELVDTMCRLDSMVLSELPLGDLDLEAETVDAELKEARAARNEAIGIVPVTTVARHRDSGEVVANTVIGVLDDPDFRHGFQWITIVHPDHRGHRLGTLVKVVNLRLLRARFPQVETIWTDNADVNSHMGAINAVMGFEAVDAVGEHMLRLDS